MHLKNLPEDPRILRRLVVDFAHKNSSLSQENQELRDEIADLREQLALERAKKYGASSEKIRRELDEMELRAVVKDEAAALCEAETDVEAKAEDEEEFEEVPVENRQDPDSTQPKNAKIKPGRIKLPENLLREERLIPAPDTCPDCGSKNFRKIADDVSETLEYEPATFKVIKHIRPRCACINCEKVVQAYPVSKAIPKSKAGVGLLSHIIVSKYADHLPLYRQGEIFERQGIIIPQSTMSRWMIKCEALLEPLIEVLRKEIFASSHIYGDDTPVRVLAPGQGKTKTGRFWVYVRDTRPYGDHNIPPAVCYFYSPDRKGIRPEEHLKDFTGVLHADAYSGYNGVLETDKIQKAGCWAHVRRKFHEVTIASDNAKIALDALDDIGKIYDIERAGRGQEPEIRRKMRQEKSRGIIDELFKSWKKVYPQLPQKSSTAKAIAYALNNETHLRRFLSDGKIEVDNNASERALRPVAVGRKNWLFAGSDKGGEAAAAMYSLLETCELNNVNPWEYMRWVLEKIQDHNSQKLYQLLPWNMPKTLL